MSMRALEKSIILIFYSILKILIFALKILDLIPRILVSGNAFNNHI
jgi:hypothetical protein